MPPNPPPPASVRGPGVHAELLAVVAALAAGCRLLAVEHLREAQRLAEPLGRRERHLCEIVGLACGGRDVEARGLSVEHVVEHPDDAPVISAMYAVLDGA
jgi:hypothetical protein